MFIFLIIMVYLIIWLFARHIQTIENFNGVFLSIVEKGIPFIVISVFIAEMIRQLINESNIYKVIPRSRGLALITTSIIGLICPVFKSNIVEFSASLVKNKVPDYVAVTFMISVPVINPITILSTFLAFSNNIGIALLRIVGTILIAISVGYIVIFLRFPILKVSNNNDQSRSKISYSKSLVSDTVKSVVIRIGLSIIDVLKYFIPSAIIVAFIRTVISNSIILNIEDNKLLLIIIAMFISYLMSVSSAVDAFIAAVLLNIFIPYSIVAFIMFGSMIDIKNTILMRRYFSTKFILSFISLLLIFNIMFSYILSYIMI